MTVIRSAISNTSYKFVADEDDAVALCCQPAKDRKNFHGFLRGKHCSRLVQNQDFRLAVKSLQDLHPLLPANRKCFHFRIRIDLKAEALAQIDDPFAGFAFGR